MADSIVNLGPAHTQSEDCALSSANEERSKVPGSSACQFEPTSVRICIN